MLKFDRTTAKNWFILSGFAFLFILVGIIIASSLELPVRTEAVPAGTYSAGSGGVDSRSPFVSVAEKVSPAVVNISADIVSQGEGSAQMLPFDEDFMRRFFGYVPEQRDRRNFESQSLGSGFIYSSDGYILTNNHVVTSGGTREATKITVKLADGTEHQAKLVGRDPETDIAILKVDGDHKFPYVELGDSDSIHVGEWAVAIGNPFPQLGLDRSLTVGVISATGRKGLYFGDDNTPYIQNYIQTDAAINPGNSGGPLVDIEGRVIGINAAITSPYPRGGNIGIGFAIPVNLAKQIIPDLVSSGTVSRGYLGISPRGITAEVAEALKLKSNQGVLVQLVQPGTPADEAGMKAGDVIVRFDNNKITDEDQFRRVVAATAPGKTVKTEILREGVAKTLQVKLGVRAALASTQSIPEERQTEEDWMGISVRTATRPLAEKYSVQFDEGVIVTDVDPDSPAGEKGIEVGDLIVKIDGQRVTDYKTFSQITSQLSKSKRAVSVLLLRGETGRSIFFALKETD
ncbi:MAG: Do family serine endopeptidase [candidate division Zixibacteria bacterium]|nr:Do family serine endopeptidase [candidate division Zixibacteria bacterium]